VVITGWCRLILRRRRSAVIPINDNGWDIGCEGIVHFCRGVIDRWYGRGLVLVFTSLAGIICGGADIGGGGSGAALMVVLTLGCPSIIVAAVLGSSKGNGAVYSISDMGLYLDGLQVERTQGQGQQWLSTSLWLSWGKAGNESNVFCWF
jgi:hypothetical protein